MKISVEELLKHLKNIVDEEFVLTEEQLLEFLKPKILDRKDGASGD